MRGAPQVGFSAPCERSLPELPLESVLANRPSHFGNQLPIQPEASSMPLDHRFRVDHDKSLFPPGPEHLRQDAEQLIEIIRVLAWDVFVSTLRVAGEEQGFQVEDFDAHGKGKKSCRAGV